MAAAREAAAAGVQGAAYDILGERWPPFQEKRKRKFCKDFPLAPIKPYHRLPLAQFEGQSSLLSGDEVPSYNSRVGQPKKLLPGLCNKTEQ